MITLKIKCHQCGKFNAVEFESVAQFDANADAIARCKCGGLRTMADVRILRDERWQSERIAKAPPAKLALGED